MDRVHLMAFSLDRDALLDYSREIQSICDRKSVDYKGPSPLPVFKFQGPLTDIAPKDWLEETPHWVRELGMDESDFSRLQSFEQADDLTSLALFCRQFEVYDSGTVQEAVALPLPETVCLHVNVDTIEHHTGGEHSPYTYDPGREHVTDLDFEAHHS
ncbi:hypothetical protein [Natrarchaeobius chitinivorans]|nr:hypothetical protein [Natrarchaeobius chitinivorans]